MDSESIHIDQNWFAFYTNPRAEKKILDRLTEIGINAFLPLKLQEKIWSDRKKIISTPLIPSYIFIHCTEKQIAKHLQHPGLVSVVKHLNKPAVIKDYEIENLKILCCSNQEIDFDQSNLDFNIGEDIIVTKGVFKGVIGRLIRVKNKFKIVVSIEALGSQISFEIPISYVEKISKT